MKHANKLTVTLILLFKYCFTLEVFLGTYFFSLLYLNHTFCRIIRKCESVASFVPSAVDYLEHFVALITCLSLSSS